MKKRIVSALALAAFGVFLAAGQAQAIPTLRITTESGTTKNIYTVADEAALSMVNKNLYGDFISDFSGVVSWTGNLGNWFVSATGTTKDAIGSSAVPDLHLNGWAHYYGKSSPGTFTVEFSETFFGKDLDISALVSNLDGSDSLAQSLKVYLDTSNTLFGRGSLIADLDELGDSFHYGPLPQFDSPFSLTMVSSITMAPRSVASFDNTVVPNPEPATMLLLGTGLAGLAGASRRRMNRMKKI